MATVGTCTHSLVLDPSLKPTLTLAVLTLKLKGVFLGKFQGYQQFSSTTTALTVHDKLSEPPQKCRREAQRVGECQTRALQERLSSSASAFTGDSRRSPLSRAPLLDAAA